MKIEQIHSLALSIFCSLMLGSTLLNPTRNMLLAGMGGGLDKQVKDQIGKNLFDMSQSGWEKPSEPSFSVPKVESKKVDIAVENGEELSLVAERVLQKGDETDLSKTARAFKLISGGNQYQVKQIMLGKNNEQR